MMKLFAAGKKIYYLIGRRIKKMILVLPYVPGLQGSLADKLNYFRRYINPCINVLEERYKNLNMSKDSIKQEMRSSIKEICLSENELYMSRLVVVLGTKCSLRCRDCNNLMPYFKNPCELDTQKIIESIYQISKNVKLIFQCELIGGEPFLAQNLKKVLEYVISIDSIKDVVITTNGTIIPRDEALLRILQNPKVCVRISNYGNVVDSSNFAACLTANNIRYNVLQLETWISPGNVQKRNKDVNAIKKEYIGCKAEYLCKTLFKDKLFSCARAASLYALGILPDEYVYIDESLTAEKLKKFLLKDFSIACDYCDVASVNKKKVEPAIQLYY